MDKERDFRNYWGKKENVLVISIFSFFHNVFYTIKDWATTKLLSAYDVHLHEAKILSSGKGLTL